MKLARLRLFSAILLTILLNGWFMPLWLADNPRFTLGVQAAKKKKKKLSDKEITTLLEPISKDLGTISAKVRSRRLLSPEENDKLSAAYDTLAGLMQDASGNPQILTPLYQVGLLLKDREQWLEAYDALDYVVQNYGNTPYAVKARRYLVQIRPHVAEYLPAEPTLEGGKAPAATTPEGKSPATAAAAGAPASAPAKKP